MEVSKTWPGVPKELWPSLNKLADAVNTALNWRTDGSLVVEVQGGVTKATVQFPDPIVAMVLGGSNPYSWARVVPDDDGVWYVDSANGLWGQCDSQVTSAITDISFNAGTLTFECQNNIQDAGITVGATVRVRGVNPQEFDNDYVVTAVYENFFDASVAASPGTYERGGGACFDVIGATAYRPTWEENDNIYVPVGAIVRMEQRILNSDDDTEYEYRFIGPFMPELVQKTPAQWWADPVEWWSPPPAGITGTRSPVISVACINNQIVYVTEAQFYNNGQLQQVT